MKTLEHRIFKKTVMALSVMAAISQSTYAEQDMALSEASTPDVEEIVVLGSRKANFTEITENTQKLLDMPGALGDPLGAITALPGVVTPADGGAPAVRGSSPSDNRYFVDGIPAGYIFHEFNTSVLDENVVQDFQLFSAGFGAQYADSTGAIFDVRLRDPKHQKIQTKISASLLRAGVFVEGEVSENAAFYLSAREGLIQYFIPEDDEPDEDGIRIVNAPSDSDYQMKYLWEKKDHRITILLAGATDGIEADLADYSEWAAQNPDFGGRAKFKSSFDSQGVTWEHTLDNGSDFKLSVAHYEDVNQLRWGDGYFQDITFGNQLIKGHYQIPLGEQHSVRIGMEANNYEYDYSVRTVLFVCTDFDVDCQDGRGEILADSRTIQVTDNSLYVVDTWQINAEVQLETGLQRASNDYTDEEFIHPRVAVTWDVNPLLTVTSSAGSYNRFPDLETVLPLIGNPDLESPTAKHYTLGFKGDVGEDWNWSIETYFKELESLPLARGNIADETVPLYSNNVEGEARGVEIMLNRNLNNGWYGWASLSYSESERTNMITGETRTYQLDTPIVFNLVGSYELSSVWTLGFRFAAKSGEATTEITGIKTNPNFPDKYLPVYGAPYEDRLPVYARLDLRAEKSMQLFGRDGSFYVDVINALNTENVVSRELDYARVSDTGELHIERQKDMGIFPSVGIAITF